MRGHAVGAGFALWLPTRVHTQATDYNGLFMHIDSRTLLMGYLYRLVLRSWLNWFTRDRVGVRDADAAPQPSR